MNISRHVVKCADGFRTGGKSGALFTVRFLVALSALLMCNRVTAKTWTLKSDGTNAQGLRDCEWTDSDGNISKILNGEDDYVAEASIFVTSIEADGTSLNTFTGKSLRIGTVGSGKRRMFKCYGGKAWFKNDGLVLANGYLLVRYPNADNRLYGKITATATKSYPFVIDYMVDNIKNFSSDTVYFDGPLAGDGHILVRPIGYNDKSYGRIGILNLSIDGDASGFTGGIKLESVHLRVDPSFSWSGALCQAGLELPLGNMPASIEVGTNSILAANGSPGVTSIKSLSLGNESELVFKTFSGKTENDFTYVTNASIFVSEAFSLDGKVKIKVEDVGYDFKSGVPAYRLGLLTVPINSNVSEYDFELAETDSLARFMKLLIEENPDDGTKTLVLSRESVVSLVKGDSSNIVQYDVGSVAIADASCWSDDVVPHDGSIYCLHKKVFRTPWNPEGSYRLKGTSWLLSETEFCVLASLLEVEELVVMPNQETFISCQYTTRPTTLKGRVFMDSATLRLTAYAKGMLVIDGEISGKGTIVCEGNNRGSGNPGGYYWLAGRNANYSGKVKLTMDLVDGRPISFYEDKSVMKFNSLYVSDSLNLGGAMSPADPKGVTIENMSRIQVLETMEFDEPTRGFYIGWVGRIDVAPGKTMTLKNPLAVNGTLWKENAGCLALGNETVRFGSSATGEMPPADSTNHMFLVAGGSVKPLAAGCMDGLDVVVSNNTRFVFDLNPHDAVLRKEGIRNIKTDAPFSCAAGTESVAVEFEGVPPAAGTFTNGLFTVKAGEVANSLRSKIKMIRPADRWYAIKMLELSADGGEHVTFAAEFRKVGMTISIR